ncbi:Zinc finger, SWIM-type [Melia azedarach]|uniref:Zinc finger, SWIM-type n=1 Tax=Melia azedarach TaxID=155640 RepID=A0ACC1XEX4_MELAZ|nr:Zinc finger, SWIM-type [Melia azedarach]
MAAAGAGEMMLVRCAFEGSLSMHDVEIERRPYHKNCGCALHNQKGSAAVCSIASAKHNNLSFRSKKSWAHCSMSMAAAAAAPKNSFSSSQPSLIYSTADSGICHSSEQTRLEIMTT